MLDLPDFLWQRPWGEWVTSKNYLPNGHFHYFLLGPSDILRFIWPTLWSFSEREKLENNIDSQALLIENRLYSHVIQIYYLLCHLDKGSILRISAWRFTSINKQGSSRVWSHDGARRRKQLSSRRWDLPTKGKYCYFRNPKILNRPITPLIKHAQSHYFRKKRVS